MPLYTYQCACGYQFEARNSMDKHSEPKACPLCQGVAPRMMPKDVPGVFAATVTEVEVAAPNTGVSQIDANADRAIGASARKGWEVIGRRYAQKRQLLEENPGVTGHDLSKNLDGGYRIMRPEETQIHLRAVEMAKNWPTKQEGEAPQE